MAGERSGGRQDPVIPDRMFFRIGDVSALVGVESHVLRFWESEFPSLTPRKTNSGQRQYRRKDVETVIAIKRLLYDEGYTIAGARRALRSKREPSDQALRDQSSAGPAERATTASPDALQEIRAKLTQILELLGPSR